MTSYVEFMIIFCCYFTLISDGYFMFVDTQADEEGKSTSFWSPPFSLYNDTNTCINFFMRSYSKYSFETKLKIYLFVEKSFYSTHTLIKEYDLTIEESTEWKKRYIQLPKGGG